MEKTKKDLSMKMDQLIIPCSGRGSRFHAITDTPKYLIDIAGRPMLDWSLCSMEQGQHFSKVVVILHIDQVHGSQEEITHVENTLRFYLQRVACEVEFIWQEHPLAGAADSVLLAKEFIDPSKSVAVWNCDQYCVNWNRELPDADGHILTFHNPDKNPKWSYVRLQLDPDITTLSVTEVREKNPISDIATVGAYFFKTGRDLFWAIEEMMLHNEKVNGEFYLAPVYNYLIKLGRTIIPINAPGMEGLGTPEDCDLFVQAHRLPNWRKK